MKEGWKIYQFGELVTFDKRFKGIDRTKQKNIVTFNHVTAELLKSLPVDGGDVKLLATGLFDGYTTKEKAGSNLNNGEVITIPTGGNANIKYYKGSFVDSGNILAVSSRADIYLRYIWYYLVYQNVYLESCFKGTGIKHPFMPDIWNIKVPVPSLSEQERIVSYLDAQFAKIDALKANTEQQLHAAKDLFQSALKEYLEPKVGWADVCIKELGNCRIGPFGSLLHKSDYIEGGVPLINPMHIKGGKIEADIRYSVNKSKYQELKNYSLLKNDIILGRRGEMGRCAVVEDKEDGWLCGTGCMYLRPNIQKVNPHFLRYCLSSPVYVNKLTELAGGATMLNLSGSAFETLSIKIPNIDEQNAIISKLSLLADKVARLQANYDQTITLCNDLKQSLLKSIFA